MHVGTALIQIDLMLLEVYVVQRKRDLPGHEGKEMCLCKPMKGQGHAWLDRTKLMNYEEVIRPCSTS